MKKLNETNAILILNKKKKLPHWISVLFDQPAVRVSFMLG